MYGKIVYTAIFVIISCSYAIATTFNATIYPTPLVYKHKEFYCQRIIIQADQEFEGQIIASLDGVVTKKNTGSKVKEISIDCYRRIITQPSHLDVTIKNNNTIITKKTLTIPPVKLWKIYCVPFTHVDIGFTQSQKNIRTQNIKNIDTALAIIEKTQLYPKGSSFKMFTEVSWPIQEYLYDESIKQEKKIKLITALKRGQLEPGAFIISHQNRFLTPEAIVASLHTTFTAARPFNIPVKTACIHDVMDFSKLTKVLYANSIPYVLIGPNDARYIVPPLFYLASPDGSASVLVWHSVGLNGYGENFDLAMRLSVPFDKRAFEKMENHIALHFAQLEKGYPTANILQYYDYNGRHWDYPYDAYLLPFYPAEGGDNQPQNTVPSEIAKQWNETFINPKIVIATPSQFFDYVQSKYHSSIPRLKGEMTPFWGEQIYLDFIQVDPQRLASEYAFTRGIFRQAIKSIAQPHESDNLSVFLQQYLAAYKAILLNSDHNPRPVPFGKTHYTPDDVKDWMKTRDEWAKVPASILKKWNYYEQMDEHTWQKVEYGKGPIVIENPFYSVTIAPEKGEIVSIVDKETNKEWVRADSYGFNAYLQVVRGENGALRNYFAWQKGYSSTEISLFSHRGDYKVVIEGKVQQYYRGLELLSDFLHSAFGVSLPPWLLKAVYFFYQLFTPSLSLTQEIIIPHNQKHIECIQRFSGSQPQVSEHVFSYPLEGKTIFYDSAFTPLQWGSSLEGGDSIPAARNIAPFKSINDTLYPFQWMHGLPPSFHCDYFVMAKDGNHYAVFVPLDSKAIIPENAYDTTKKGFYHCCIGWTLWGKLGLGRSLEGETVFRSVFTSFKADTHNMACMKAYQKSFEVSGMDVSRFIEVKNPAIRPVWLFPHSTSRLTVGLFEVSGTSQRSYVYCSSKSIKRAYYSTSDGIRLKDLNVPLMVTMYPYELKFITIETF